MTQAPNDPVVVSADGVTVEKRFEPDDFPVPTILFDVRSEREVPVAVRLVDSAPRDLEAEDIGFHPEYGAECWSVEDEDVVFYREIEPGASYRTVYGLREGSVDDPGRLLTDPEITSVEPMGEGSDPDEVTAAISEIEGDETPEIDLSDPSAGSTNGDEDAIEPIDFDDPDEESADGESVDDLSPGAEPSGTDSNADPTDSDGERFDETASVGAPLDDTSTGLDDGSSGESGADSVASALAEEIRAGDVPERDLEAFRGALDFSGEGSVDARIQQVQTRLADFDAYVDALEEFLDENGDTQTVLRDLERNIEGVEDRVETLEAQIDGALEEIDQRTEKLASAVESEIDDMWEDLDVTRSSLADLEAAHGTLASDVEEIDDDLEGVDDLEDDVEAVAAEIERLDEELSEMAGMRERLGDLEGSHETLASDVREIDDVEGELETVVAEVERLDEELSELAEMRERLTDAFGSIG